MIAIIDSPRYRKWPYILASYWLALSLLVSCTPVRMEQGAPVTQAPPAAHASLVYYFELPVTSAGYSRHMQAKNLTITKVRFDTVTYYLLDFIATPYTDSPPAEMWMHVLPVQQELVPYLCVRNPPSFLDGIGWRWPNVRKPADLYAFRFQLFWTYRGNRKASDGSGQTVLASSLGVYETTIDQWLQQGIQLRFSYPGGSETLVLPVAAVQELSSEQGALSQNAILQTLIDSNGTQVVESYDVLSPPTP